MRGLHQCRCPRGTDRTPPDNSIIEFERLTTFILEKRWRCGHGCGFAPVQGGDLPRLAIIPDQKGTSPQAGALRFHQTQDSLNRHHGIDRYPSKLKNFQAGIDC